MGDVIRFPIERRLFEVELERPMDECDGQIHVFMEVPGRCRCGENEWTPEHTIEPDGIGIHAVYDPPPAS